MSGGVLISDSVQLLLRMCYSLDVRRVSVRMCMFVNVCVLSLVEVLELWDPRAVGVARQFVQPHIFLAQKVS